MKKRQIIILILAGGMSFISVFTVGWFLNRKSAAAMAANTSSSNQDPSPVSDAGNPKRIDFSRLSGSKVSMGMSEQQLQNLMLDIRNKSKEHKDRQKALDMEAVRIEITSQSLQDDIDRLNELRDKLVMILSDIEQKQTQLQKSIIEIQAIEQGNFKRLASTYEKMAPEQAGSIMVNMAASNQLQDSVKILYYMNERTAGKLLSEIAVKKPELASLICMQLKHIKEGT